MGINIFGSHSSYDNDNFPKEKSINPDPYNYRIEEYRQIGNVLIVKIIYPDCENYEGRKILVYENVDINKLKKQTHIDPHFSDSSEYISPIARFKPTERGMVLAKNLAHEIKKSANLRCEELNCPMDNLSKSQGTLYRCPTCSMIVYGYCFEDHKIKHS